MIRFAVHQGIKSIHICVYIRHDLCCIYLEFCVAAFFGTFAVGVNQSNHHAQTIMPGFQLTIAERIISSPLNIVIAHQVLLRYNPWFPIQSRNFFVRGTIPPFNPVFRVCFQDTFGTLAPGFRRNRQLWGLRLCNRQHNIHILDIPIRAHSTPYRFLVILGQYFLFFRCPIQIANNNRISCRSKCRNNGSHQEKVERFMSASFALIGSSLMHIFLREAIQCIKQINWFHTRPPFPIVFSVFPGFYRESILLWIVKIPSPPRFPGP